MELFSPGEVRSLAKPAGAENLDTLDDVANAEAAADFQPVVGRRRGRRAPEPAAAPPAPPPEPEPAPAPPAPSPAPEPKAAPPKGGAVVVVAPVGAAFVSRAPAERRVAAAEPDAFVPPECFCPISMALMQEPYLATDGHTYERECIAAWLENHDTSPLTNDQLPSKMIIPNHALRSLIMTRFQHREHPPDLF